MRHSRCISPVIGSPQSRKFKLRYYRPRAARSAEGIDNPDPVHLAAMRQILAEQLAAAERAGRGDNSAVPIGETVRRLDLQRTGEDRHRQCLHLEAGPGGDQRRGGLVRQPPDGRGHGSERRYVANDCAFRPDTN